MSDVDQQRLPVQAIVTGVGLGPIVFRRRCRARLFLDQRECTTAPRIEGDAVVVPAHAVRQRVGDDDVIGIAVDTVQIGGECVGGLDRRDDVAVVVSGDDLPGPVHGLAKGAGRCHAGGLRGGHGDGLAHRAGPVAGAIAAIEGRAVLQRCRQVAGAGAEGIVLLL